VPLNGSVAFTSRAMGFLARPFFPDGIDINSVNGPFSKPINIWSPFNTGLQLALVKPALASILSGGTPPSGDPFNCSPIPNDITVGAGLMIFAGSVPLFKNGVLVGAIGISGDGIEQDELVAAAGAFGFDAPPAVRSDQLIVQGARLPFVVFPRHPNIGNPAPVPPIIRTSRVFPNMN
jgi:Haem-degrading